MCFRYAMHALLRTSAMFGLLLAARTAIAQTPSVSVRIPRSRINSALEQSYGIELRNRTANAVTVRVVSIAVRVGDATTSVPLEIRAVHSRVNRGGRSLTIPSGMTLTVTIDTLHRDPINLPRGESHVVVRLETPDGTVRAEGVVEPIERCLRCRRAPVRADIEGSPAGDAQ
jgi:hypothetical protein